METTESTYDDVVHTHVDEDGVNDLTAGFVIGSRFREQLRAVLKEFDPKAYADYKAIKYPNGEGSDTAETRKASHRFLFDAVRDATCKRYF